MNVLNKDIYLIDDILQNALQFKTFCSINHCKKSLDRNRSGLHLVKLRKTSQR